MKLPWLIIPALAFLAACGGSDKAEPTALPDARTVVATSTQGAATAAAKDALAIGETGKLDPVEVTITKVTRVSAADMKRSPTAPEASWLVVELTAKNPSNDRSSLPGMAIACANGGKGNRYADDDATAIKSGDMPAKTQLTGRLLFGIPDDCTAMTLTANPVLQVGGKPLPVSWRIP